MSPRRLGPGDGDYDAARRPQVARFAGVRPAACTPTDAELEHPDRAYFGANLDRVRAVQPAYDPDRVLSRPS
jgi:hypothetical protein